MTPNLMRIAYYYLCLGIGEYVPDNHPHYNKVVVRQLYEFKESEKAEGVYAGGIIVEFLKDGRRIRWLEFNCSPVGFGGDDIVKEVI
jgi:hypothetical protein